MEAIVEESIKAISGLTMASSTTAAASSSSSGAPSKKALKKELKMKHKEEETRLKEDKKGGPKDNKNKGFHMEEEEMAKAKAKGPFEVYYGLIDMNGETVPFDQARVMLFKKYKERAEACYGQPLTRFVVIIPENSYDARLHKMIRGAAKTAGLDLKRIIVNGPNADQYPYGLTRRHGDPITTLDFSSSKGYGTTVNQFHNIPNLCLEANGTVFDNRLDEAVEYLKLAHGVDFTEDPSALQDLSEALERATVTKSKVMIKLPAADGDDPRTIRTVSLRDFEF